MKKVTYDENKFVLVPIEPTEEMQDAGVPSMPTVDCHPYDAGMVYKAMLAAAPHPVIGEQKPIEMADIVKALESVPGAPMLTSNMCYAIAQAINAHRAQQGEQPS